MDGGSQPLRTWEKVYWGVFVTGFSVFLLSRVSVWTSAEPEDPAVSPSLLHKHACPVLRSSFNPCRDGCSQAASHWLVWALN